MSFYGLLSPPIPNVLLCILASDTYFRLYTGYHIDVPQAFPTQGYPKLNRLFIIFYSAIPSLLPSCIKYILNIYFYYLFIFTFIYGTQDFIILPSAVAVYFPFIPVIVKRKFSNSHMVNWHNFLLGTCLLGVGYEVTSL